MSKKNIDLTKLFELIDSFEEFQIRQWIQSGQARQKIDPDLIGFELIYDCIDKGIFQKSAFEKANAFQVFLGEESWEQEERDERWRDVPQLEWQIDALKNMRKPVSSEKVLNREEQEILKLLLKFDKLADTCINKLKRYDGNLTVDNVKSSSSESNALKEFYEGIVNALIETDFWGENTVELLREFIGEQHRKCLDMASEYISERSRETKKETGFQTGEEGGQVIDFKLKRR